MLLHKEIFTKEQIELFPLIEKFGKDFVLVGGTAIALQIGHRESIDFDMFSYEEFNTSRLKNKILKHKKINKTYRQEDQEFTFLINGVKITFYHFRYKIEAPIFLGKLIRLPDLLTLAAIKAFALGQRSKWKDYVDLYFILKDHFTIDQISKKARELFNGEFNARIFREALAYFDDINYEDKVVFLPGFETPEKVIKKISC